MSASVELLLSLDDSQKTDLLNKIEKKQENVKNCQAQPRRKTTRELESYPGETQAMTRLNHTTATTDT